MLYRFSPRKDSFPIDIEGNEIINTFTISKTITMDKTYDTDKKIIQQREHYANIAGEFDTKYNRENSNHFYKIEEIENAFCTYLKESGDGWDLMEIGAGSGIHGKHVVDSLGKKVKSLLLSDLSGEMLENAKKKIA